MNRPLVFISSVLALAIGAWVLSSDSDSSGSPTIATPEASATLLTTGEPALPLFAEPEQEEEDSQPQRGALKLPTLSLLARSASDGQVLTQARATIEPKNQAATVKKTGANRARDQKESKGAGASFFQNSLRGEPDNEQRSESSTLKLPITNPEGIRTDLNPGEWKVTIEANGYISQSVDLELALGDEESVELSLSKGGLVQGSVRDRFGRAIGGSRIIFLAPGQSFPRFPRDLPGVLSTPVDREGNITPISLPPENYTIAYGSLGSPKVQTTGRVNAGETSNLEVVFGGKSRVRFELDNMPEEKMRKVEVRLEAQDQKRIERDKERDLRNPERALKAKAAGKVKGRWKTSGRATIREGVGELFNAKPGTYRVTLVARPGEYSSTEFITIEADESILVKIQAPMLPVRSGAKRNDPKTPTEGPLNISVIRNPPNPEWMQDGIYWR